MYIAELNIEFSKRIAHRVFDFWYHCLIIIINMVPVVQKTNSAIHQINLYPPDSAIGFPNNFINWLVIYHVDSAIQLLNNWGLL